MSLPSHADNSLATTVISSWVTHLMVMSSSSMWSCLSPVSINAPMRTCGHSQRLPLVLGSAARFPSKGFPDGQWTPAPNQDGPLRRDTSEEIIRRVIPMIPLLVWL